MSEVAGRLLPLTPLERRAVDAIKRPGFCYVLQEGNCCVIVDEYYLLDERVWENLVQSFQVTPNGKTFILKGPHL